MNTKQHTERAQLCEAVGEVAGNSAKLSFIPPTDAHAAAPRFENPQTPQKPFKNFIYTVHFHHFLRTVASGALDPNS